jgi:hypothetical protein
VSDALDVISLKIPVQRRSVRDCAGRGKDPFHLDHSAAVGAAATDRIEPTRKKAGGSALPRSGWWSWADRCGLGREVRRASGPAR